MQRFAVLTVTEKIIWLIGVEFCVSWELTLLWKKHITDKQALRKLEPVFYRAGRPMETTTEETRRV